MMMKLNEGLYSPFCKASDCHLWRRFWLMVRWKKRNYEANLFLKDQLADASW